MILCGTSMQKFEVSKTAAFSVFHSSLLFWHKCISDKLDWKANNKASDLTNICSPFEIGPGESRTLKLRTAPDWQFARSNYISESLPIWNEQFRERGKKFCLTCLESLADSEGNYNGQLTLANLQFSWLSASSACEDRVRLGFSKAHFVMTLLFFRPPL